MSIEQFYTTSIAVSRMVWVGDSSGQVAQDSFNGHVQQAQPETAEYVGEALGETFLIWCDEATDVEKGDTLTIASGNYAGTYSVKAIQTNAVGRNKHLELIIVKDKD